MLEMSIKKTVIKSAKEMQIFSAKFAKKILQKQLNNQATVLCLSGELGSGKTTFVQELANGLGIKEKITSPTFIIMKRFKIYDLEFKNFYHFDCYRIINPEEILQLGFKEIISKPENIVAIEWPEKIAQVLPKKIISIRFKHKAENIRILTIKSNYPILLRMF